MDTIFYRREQEIPVIAETDVLVVGGGPGGLGAAVMAARQGVRVVLVERYGCAGGMATFGEVTPFMPNHLDGVTLDKPVFVDWCRKMWEYRDDKSKDGEFDENIVPGTKLSKDIAMLAMEDLLLEAGVRVIYHHTLADVIRSGNRIEAAVFSSKSGFCAIRAKQYVDSTGDGDLAVFIAVIDLGRIGHDLQIRVPGQIQPGAGGCGGWPAAHYPDGTGQNDLRSV